MALANNIVRDLTNYDMSSLLDKCKPVEIVDDLISLLTDKEANVIVSRYGLRGSQIKTLAALGQEYGITRERVRQIQAYALKKLQRNAVQTNIAEMHVEMMRLLMNYGGVVTEVELENFLKFQYPDLNEKVQELKLAVVLDDRIIQEHNKVNFQPHFRLSSIKITQIKKTCELAIKLLKKFNSETDLDLLFSEIRKYTKENYLHYANSTLAASLLLDRRLVNKADKYSLIGWRHINPKTLYDKVVFVLGQEKQPLHFLDIVENIKNQGFDAKKVSLQAVHNELISNPAFVLIGRGIYALKTWGYKDGTVSDVLESVLAKMGPLNLKVLTAEVLKLRKVKPITIQINLSSKKHKFRKNKEGLYELV